MPGYAGLAMSAMALISGKNGNRHYTEPMVSQQALSHAYTDCHRATVPYSTLQKLLQVARAQGVDELSLCARAGIAGSDTGPCSARAYSRLYSELARELEDECLGFYPDWKMPCGSFALLCRIMVSCLSLREALTEADRFLGLLAGGTKADPRWGADTSGQAWIVYPHSAVRANSLFNHQNGIAGALASWQRLCSWLLARPVTVRRVSLRGAQRVDAAKFERIFQSPLQFNADHNRLYFDAQTLNWPVQRNAAQLNAFLVIAPFELIALRELDAERNASVSHRVRVFLEQSSDLAPGLESAARQLGLSARSLRRQLASEQTSFMAIKDNLRLQQAEALLRHSRLHIHEIALRLGFEDSSAFHRAFKRWTGVTPRHFKGD